MEQFDLLDRNRIPTGEIMDRGTKEPKDRFRQVVHIILINDKNEMLIQQRQKGKSYEFMWDVSVGGSVTRGEYAWQGAERELFEELGIKADFSKTLPIFSVPFGRGFDDFYMLDADDIKISDLKLQDSEVKTVKWATKEEILKMIENKEFLSYRESLIGLMFDMKANRSGCFRNDIWK